MIPESVRADEEDLVRRGTGLGGGSRSAAGATCGERSGRTAEDALTAWEKGTGAFPYTELTRHYQAVGRDQASPALVRRLAAVPRSRQDAFLAAWLPMTCDQESGGYPTYAGLPSHLLVTGGGTGRSVPGAAGDPERRRVLLDELTAAVVGELAGTEATAALLSPIPAVRARLRATVRVLTHLDVLAPGHRLDPAVCAYPAEALARTEGPLSILSDAAQRAAKAIGEQVSTEMATTAAWTVLPVTRLHDEIMFIRTIQIFEALYEQIGLAVTATRDLLVEGQVADGTETLARAVDRMTILPSLFRLLGTMPVASFAVIRGYTSGRSAVQSHSYRRVEIACAERPAPSVPGAATPSWTGPTLQEAYLEFRKAPGAVRLAEQFARLDTAWRGMKRSHWAITLRIIGKVPGTGGTTGASYLRTASETPLFPALAEKENLS
ncbi:tryptophan 2,3-dioxygenase family protein [Streptomyces albidoflavus]